MWILLLYIIILLKCLASIIDYAAIHQIYLLSKQHNKSISVNQLHIRMEMCVI